ncbi:hypothetical protein M9H77_18757 [Catharanthus roseus]|uniref:Uncharacterized protein n=1 Tax=Catharanthus roseus TaxID=4058 RepID=A0ACC0B8D6_CATRO|nr:hypothetical protein M9H77_18757 [Catharanthus roseus]
MEGTPAVLVQQLPNAVSTIPASDGGLVGMGNFVTGQDRRRQQNLIPHQIQQDPVLQANGGRTHTVADLSRSRILKPLSKRFKPSIPNPREAIFVGLFSEVGRISKSVAMTKGVKPAQGVRNNTPAISVSLEGRSNSPYPVDVVHRLHHNVTNQNQAGVVQVEPKAPNPG